MRAVSIHEKPLLELHLNNIFRHDDQPVRPLVDEGARSGLICGLGRQGYPLAVKAAAGQLES